MPSDLEGLLAWIRNESPTEHAAGVNRVMDLVAAEAAEVGLACERVPGRDGLGDSVILRAGPAREGGAVLVLSHLDTVHPRGTLERDLPVRFEGDRLYGPGVYDMKGGAWLAFQAFKDVGRAGTAKSPLVFLFTPDEEIGSPTTRTVIEDLGSRAAAVLVTEPARNGGKLVTCRKGVARFDIEIEGRPSHAGSRHEDGRSAIREAARQILAIEGMTDYARGVTTNVGLVSGGTAVNVVPQRCRLTVDLRVVTEAQGEEVGSAILGLRPHDSDVRMRITGGMNRPPYERSDGTGRLFAHAQGVARGLGFELGEVPRTGGGSDGNFTAALGIPTLDGLGIDGDGAHTLQEYGLVSSIAPRRALMRGLLETL